MLKQILVCLVLTVILVSVPCRAEEPDHEIHEELRPSEDRRGSHQQRQV